MNMTTINNRGPRLSEADILRLETQLKSPLPTEYKDFLLATNGGRPTLDTIDIPKFQASPTDVQVFFGLDRSVVSSCIEWNMTTLVERFDPSELLPIACDSCGSVFCLSLRPGDFGAVLYCDLQSVFADYESSPDFYVVAPSFASFLEKLRPFA